MRVAQRCETSFRLDGQFYDAMTRIEASGDEPDMVYQAILEDSPLAGLRGGPSRDISQALDFLNTSMQAAGADEIALICHHGDEID